MKKRVVLVVAICLLAVMFCAFAVACDNKGLSAYELAVQNGFNGTLDEWLESLKGEDGLNGADGADGSNGADGKDGLNGRNGLDGQDVSIEEIFQKAQAAGYNKSFLEFLKDYLSLNVKDDNFSSSQALLSSVIVSCSYTYMDGGYYWTPPVERQATSSGSGVIFKLDKENGEAYIITNYHVVYSSDATEATSTDGIIDDIRIFLYGAEYVNYAIAADYIGGSENYDIAVLKIQSEQLTSSSLRAVTVVDSDEVLVGSSAVVVGNAAGYGLSVTQGIVSVDSEYITVSNVQFRVMRIDAAVNEGNSGGGLFNTSGQLIGIVNAKAASTSLENMGYAIPANVAAAVAESIIYSYENEEEPTLKLSKLTLGVQVAVSSSRGVYDEHTLSTKIVEDVVIKSVDEGGLAEISGLKADDVIKSVKINGVVKEITRTFQVVDLMLGVREGDTIEFVISRVEIEDVEDGEEGEEVQTPIETTKTLTISITATAEYFVKIN
ncbi:MAG: S1C family serine protease [Clostridia bacterium]|nr:S1C family serine protease [Clostridia bacterium]MDE7328850.1 S1C family serine protease [Clostridia bacterium]